MAGATAELFVKSLQLQEDLTPTSSGSTICSYRSQVDDVGPIALLIHGYPQSAYMWRYLIPELKSQFSLFVPELPGYGVSTLPSPGQHSKRAVGGAILEALASVFSIPPQPETPRKLILIGHDRGARISHRLAVDKLEALRFELVSLIFLDIVPTKVQWQVFSNPQAGLAYFHWPFLANVEQATKMIEAYGGDNWCRDMLTRGQGSSSAGQASFAAGGAHEVYAKNFKNTDAIRGSCADYQCGGVLEVREQSEDMEAGRKINVPTLVMFSEQYLGKMHDVAAVWKDWISEGVKYESVGIAENRGHYLPEEHPDQINERVLDWVTRYGR